MQIHKSALFAIILLFLTWIPAADRGAKETEDTATPEAAVAPIRNITLAEAKAWVEAHRDAEGQVREGFVILDLRTPKEVAQGHIAGATALDFLAGDFAVGLQALDRSAGYLIHCASGGRGGKALEQMRELGFEQVLHMNEGMRGWQGAGYPVVSP